MRAPLRLVAAVLLALCLGLGNASAEERSAPRDMAERLLNAPLPGREPFDLAVRLRGMSLATPVQAPVPAAPLGTGFEDRFWILDQRTAQLFQTAATLRVATDHAYWFVQTDMTERASQSDLERSANVFETRTYPVISKYFGALPSRGVDNDRHIVFFLGNVPGVAAYFSSADAYPRAVNPRSNQHEMIYVNLNTLRPGQVGFDSTITHELQHMAQFNRCPAQEGWVDEGASELAMRIAGYEGAMPTAFAAHPETQLNTWSPSTTDVVRHYQASYLFMRYVAERAGGWDALPRLFDSCARGEGLFAAFLSRTSIAPDMDGLFSDWTVANLLQDGSVADGRYAYAGGGFHAAVTGSLSRQTPFLGAVPPYAANYLELPRGTGSVTFSGDSSVALLSAPIDNAGVWWSNRGDSLDSRLTRSLDLRDVPSATLRFKAWYDLEDQFDYVYLSASRDGGRTWQVLPGRHTTSDDATGNRYGGGWTGSSGKAWVDEQVDLASLAGSELLLRFEYVTDQSYNGEGFAFRDFEVDSLDLREPGAADGPWTPDGWVRVDAPIPEHWNLRVVRWTPDGIQVEPVPVGSEGSATFTLDQSATRQLLVIAPTAPRTLVEGNYSVALAP